MFGRLKASLLIVILALNSVVWPAATAQTISFNNLHYGLNYGSKHAAANSETPARSSDLESFTSRAASESHDRVWQMTGPFGGDVTALAIDPRDADRVLIGGTDGQIFRSTDGGASWKRLRPGIKAQGFTITTILFDHEKPGVLYAGVKPQLDLDLETNDGGLFISEDNGEGWRELEGMRGRSVRGLVQSAKDANVMLVVSRNGVYRTTNRGQAWERITPTDDPELRNFHSVAMDPRDVNVIYAGTSHLPWKTSDGGQTWKRAGTKESGMIDDSDIMAIRIDESNPDTVLMSACSGIYRSMDASSKWTKLQGIPYTSRRTHVIYQHPTKPEVIYAGTTEGLWVSTTGGDPKNWRRVTSLRTVINSIAVHPSKPDRVFLGTDNGGVLISNDGGETYDISNAGFVNRNVRAVLADAKQRGRVYAGLIFDEADGGLFVSEDGGLTWQQSMEGMGVRDVYSLYQPPSNPEVLYAGTNHGLFRSEDQGRNWAEVKKVEPVEGDPLATGKTDDKETGKTAGKTPGKAGSANSEIEPAPSVNTRPRTIVTPASRTPVGAAPAGRQPGAKWKVIKPIVQARSKSSKAKPKAKLQARVKSQAKPKAKLQARVKSQPKSAKAQTRKPAASAKAKAKKPQPPPVVKSDLVDLEEQVYAVLSLKPRVDLNADEPIANSGDWLIALTWDGLFITEDEKKGWRPIKVRPAMAADAATAVQLRVNTIATSPHARGVIYVGAEDGLYVSRDNGETFKLTIIDEEVTRVRNISFDPRTAETIYIGTSTGFFRSLDGGQSWERRGGGMPSSLDVGAVVISAANNDELYLSDDQRRTLYHSKDRGKNWERLDISQLPSLRLWSISSDPFDSQRLYFGSFSGGVYVMSKK